MGQAKNLAGDDKTLLEDKIGEAFAIVLKRTYTGKSNNPLNPISKEASLARKTPTGK